jgi:hypothetical protein
MNHLLDEKVAVSTRAGRVLGLLRTGARALRHKGRRNDSGMPRPFGIRLLIAHDDPLMSAVSRSLAKATRLNSGCLRPALSASRATASDLESVDIVVADYDSGLRLLVSAGAGATSRDSDA